MLADSRSQAFIPSVIASDIQQLQTMLTSFFSTLSPEDWNRLTEKNGWTIKQTLAHLAASSTVFYQAIEWALAGKRFDIGDFKGRTDLARFNDHQIALRANLPPQAIIEELFRALDATASCALSLSPAQLTCEIDVLAYNRPLSVIELLGGQLSHPGIVHASQLTRAMGAKPLWNSYSSDFLHRQITRTFILMSHSYWPERGKNLIANLNFHVRNLGNWYVTMNPQGGTYGEGLAEHPTITMWLSSPDVLCRFFSLELSPIQAVFTGKMLVSGNLLLGLRLPSLFIPT
jgi:hypothetical protein